MFFGVLELMRLESPVSVILFGALLAAATELLRGSRFAGNGSDAAVSFWAIAYLLVGAGLQWSEGRGAGDRLFTLLLALAAVLFAAACAHWGYSGVRALAAAALFGLLGRFPAGRLWWVLAAVILMAAAYRGLDRAALAPPHRRALAGVFAVSAAALYAAVNRYSLDRRWIEALRERSSEGTAPSDALRILSALLTVLVPAAFLIWGTRTRRTLPLDLGLVFGAASLVTLRYYVHLAPLWALLSLAGAALVLGALYVHRFLRRGPGAARGGFTADPLFSGRRAERVQAAAVLAGFTPGSSPAAGRAESGGLNTGGGGFGGGGASGEY